jgi:predicted enzyme related to lactoylglutathione lyase
MKQFIACLFLLLVAFGCRNTTDSSKNQGAGLEAAKKPKSPAVNTTPRVTGIVGIFFRSKNPKGVREWYSKNLGLAMDKYGSPFEVRNANKPEEINYTRWTPFKETTDYFKPSDKEFMINYRVYDMEGLVKQLKQNGVTILDTLQTYDYGKFLHILDNDGNKIELWEPVDSIFTKMGGATTK